MKSLRPVALECATCRKTLINNLSATACFILWIGICSLGLPACSGAEKLLPSSLYFLGGPYDRSQIWRLDADGVTLTQLTNETDGITAFAVSPRDGRLAYVSADRLHLANAEGGDPRLLADSSTVDPTIEDYVFHSGIESLAFSPDGKVLAYAFDGLHLYTLASGEDEHVLKNLGNLLGEPYVFALEAYSPASWSPDGTQLLFSMGYYEGSTLAIMEMGPEKTFRRLLSEGTVCCTYSWTSDSSHILVANPWFSTDLPGLWRYDARTGQKTTLLSYQDAGDSLQFTGWPQELPSGEIVFFYFETERFTPEEGIPLKLSQSLADASEISAVRQEVFVPSEVLWVMDEPRAVLVGRVDGSDWYLYYLPGLLEPLQVLINDIEGIRRLAWGP